MRKLIVICVVAELLVAGYANAGTWTTLNMPGLGEGSVNLTGISGNYIVGHYYRDNLQSQCGLAYNMTTDANTSFYKSEAALWY